MTYFHMRMHTIIGAKSFHCPVRDGKEWDQLAMVVRHNCCRNQQAIVLIVVLLSDVIGRSKALWFFDCNAMNRVSVQNTCD